MFTVELLKAHFHIRREEDNASFLVKLGNVFRDRKHAKAVEYLESWGKSFWEETEYRIKEVTTKLESDLAASVSAHIPGLALSSDGLNKLSEEQKHEVVERAQRIVNNVQVRQLSDIIDLVDHVLTDPQKPYYIVIDRLDEDWIEDRLRYRLIRALIETVREFRRVAHAKIVVAIRIDLLERVYRLTRDAGFQEEKYESLYLPISWTKSRLIEILNSRINYLVRQRYTKQSVNYGDIMPKTVRDVPTIDFMLERSLNGPRDVILFFNECIKQASDRPNITVQMIRHAEGEFSRLRFKSLADEWYADYPNLIRFAMILKGRRDHFPAADISREDIEETCLGAAIEGCETVDVFSAMATGVVDGVIGAVDARRTILSVFFKIGLVGLKLESHEPTAWTVSGRRSISSAEITDSARVAVHPMAWRVLGIVTR